VEIKLELPHEMPHYRVTFMLIWVQLWSLHDTKIKLPVETLLGVETEPLHHVETWVSLQEGMQCTSMTSSRGWW
jgi:hypothetical protein